jgi:hypothetical protein
MNYFITLPAYILTMTTWIVLICIPFHYNHCSHDWNAADSYPASLAIT